VAVTPNSYVTAQTINASAPQTFINSDTTTKKIIFTAGASGTLVYAINFSNTDTNPYTVQVWMNVSTVNYLLTTFTLPLSAGNTAAALPVNIITPTLMPAGRYDSSGNWCIEVPAGAMLEANVTVAVTAAKTVTSVVTAAEDL